MASGAEDEDENTPLFAIGLVSDTHYDTFPAGETPDWETQTAWTREQAKRVGGGYKTRRYDMCRDKMREAATVFNYYATSAEEAKIKRTDDDNTDTSSRLAFVVNLGDLINNNLLWNADPILEVFETILVPKFSLLGNHDRRTNHDRFGTRNMTISHWLLRRMQQKYSREWASQVSLSYTMGRDYHHGDDKLRSAEQLPERSRNTPLSEPPVWYYSFSYPPYIHFIFLDSQLDFGNSPGGTQQRVWFEQELQYAVMQNFAVIIFAHSPFNLWSTVAAKYSDRILGLFFGHVHKGGYKVHRVVGNPLEPEIKSHRVHEVTLQGMILGNTNAFGILEIFTDRMELNGFGRVPTRELVYFRSSGSGSKEQDIRHQKETTVYKIFHKKLPDHLKNKKVRNHFWLRHNISWMPAAHPSSFANNAVVQAHPTDEPGSSAHLAHISSRAKMPSLHLMLPKYTKQLFSRSTVNPGATRFVKKEFPSWPGIGDAAWAALRKPLPEPPRLLNGHELVKDHGKPSAMEDANTGNTATQIWLIDNVIYTIEKPDTQANDLQHDAQSLRDAFLSSPVYKRINEQYHADEQRELSARKGKQWWWESDSEAVSARYDPDADFTRFVRPLLRGGQRSEKDHSSSSSSIMMARHEPSRANPDAFIESENVDEWSMLSFNFISVILCVIFFGRCRAVVLFPVGIFAAAHLIIFFLLLRDR